MATANQTTWALGVNGKVVGPYTTQQLADLGKAGKITSDMYVSKNGGEWKPVTCVKGLYVADAMPSERQLAYARDLGVVVVPGMTRDHLSAQMDAATGRSYKTGRFVKQTGHVTVEQTSKGLKAAMLANWLVFVVGVIAGVATFPDGHGSDVTAFGLASLATLSTFPVGLTLRIVRWWHHG
jgi:hypothetical protein